MQVFQQCQSALQRGVAFSTLFIRLHLTLRDCQNCRVNKPYRGAQDRLFWRDKTCPACHHELESVVTIINIYDGIHMSLHIAVG